MLLGLAACTDIAPADASLSESSAQASAPEESASEAPAEENTSSESSAEATPAPQDTEGGKTLVVYYSATGNTEEAARSAVRFTLGIETTKEEIDITVDTVRRLTDKLRGR